MSTRTISLMVEEDVIPFIDRHKKRAGRGDSRGRYVSRAVRCYEEVLGDENVMKSRVETAERELNDMREIARQFASRMQHYIELFEWAIQGEKKARPQWDDTKLWFSGDEAVKDQIAELLEKRKKTNESIRKYGETT